MSLEREAGNVHDHNAIKVLNVMREQVGYIKRDMAAALAPIMDNNIARLKG